MDLLSLPNLAVLTVDSTDSRTRNFNKRKTLSDIYSGMVIDDGFTLMSNSAPEDKLKTVLLA